MKLGQENDLFNFQVKEGKSTLADFDDDEFSRKYKKEHGEEKESSYDKEYLDVDKPLSPGIIKETQNIYQELLKNMEKGK